MSPPNVRGTGAVWLVAAMAGTCGGGCRERAGISPADAAVAPAVALVDSSAERTAPEGGDDAGTAPMAPCSSPGYGPGPELKSAAGQPSFVSHFNCLWPSHQRLEISVSLLQRAKRAQVEGLLQSLWKDLKATMGDGFPETVKLCVFAPDTSVLEGAALGCIRKGYEPEGEPGEEEADLRIDMPPEPAEWASWLGNSFGKRFVGAHRPRVTFDPSQSELTMVYPYVQEGTDAWAAHPSYVDVTLPFFALAWQFYPPRTTLSALTYEGVWKGKTLLRVHLRDLKAFLAMDPWGVRERLNEARLPIEIGAPRSSEQSAAIQKELEVALAKLPKGSVVQPPPAP